MSDAVQWAVVALIIFIPTMVITIVTWCVRGNNREREVGALAHVSHLPGNKGFVALRVAPHRLTVVRTEKRSWWELWQPKRYPHVIGWTTAETRPSDRVDIIGEPVEGKVVYTVRINNRPVLRTT